MLRVALAPFLSYCPQVTTLGVRPGFADYQPWERELLARADLILFPTRRFVYVFDAAGKRTFPSMASYQFRRDRVAQYSLLSYLDLPLPRTRIYYGDRQRARILDDFALPVVAMSPLGMPRREAIVTDARDLGSWGERYDPVIIQEFLPLQRFVRLVCVNYECLAALETLEYGRQPGPVRTLALGHPDLEEILAATSDLLRASALDDIVVEWGYAKSRWWVLGLAEPPAKIATPSGLISRYDRICELVAAGAL